MKHWIRALVIILAVLVLASLFLCLDVTRGDSFALSARYCETHAAFTLTLALPEELPPLKEVLVTVEEVLPPTLSLPLRLMRKQASSLFKGAREAVREELDGCTAFP